MPHYHERLFTQSGIHCPHTIQKSVPKHQAEYLAGRYLNWLLCTNQGMVAIQILSGRHGQPLWPIGWRGSIRHTDTVAIACMGRTSQIGILGIDLENELAPEMARNIAPAIVDSLESSYLFSLRSFEQMLTLAFSAKKSFFKAIYPQVGNYFDFDAVRLIEVQPDTSSFSLRVIIDFSHPVHPGKVFKGIYRVMQDHTMLTAIIG